jgi:dihydrofolate reductase
LPDKSEVSVHTGRDARWFSALKASSSAPIYLCGGGAFAAALLSMGVIDVLRLKRAPVLLGGGVRLFADAGAAPRLRHTGTRTYDGGYSLQEFEVRG